MIRVVLHGSLKDLWPHEIPPLDVSSAAEAIKALTVQLPVFRRKLGQELHRIAAVGFDTLEALFMPTDAKELHLVPQFAGGKRGGFFQILIGSALIALAIWNPAGALAATAIANVTLQSMMFSIGAALLLGGVSQLLMPQPAREGTSNENVEGSKYLGSPGNTVAIGTRIPILFGTFKAFGHFVAFDIDAKDVKFTGED